MKTSYRSGSTVVLAWLLLVALFAPKRTSASSTAKRKPWGIVPSEKIFDAQNHERGRRSGHTKEAAFLPSPPKIIIMGGPASGKGTQCERIAEQYNVVHLSTGDMLREAVARDATTGVGAIAKTYMDAGELVPDNIMIKIVMQRISQPDCVEKGWLLDGFPRTPAQAEALAATGIKADLFLFLNVPDNQLMERILGRRTDPETGKIYHLTFRPPPAEIADRLIQRADDTEDKMRNRLAQFHANVSSVRNFFEDVLVEINGSGSPDTVTGRIVGEISSRIKYPTRETV